MSPECLLALSGEVIIAVRARDLYDVRDLVRAKKIVAGELPYNIDYDFNNDGIVDEADELILRKKLLNAN